MSTRSMDVEPLDRNVLQRQCCAGLLGGCAPGAERTPWSQGRRFCCVQSCTKVKLGVLRNGKTRLAGMSAEEWGAWRSDHGRVEHVFSIEAYPAATGLGSPVLQWQMETGGALSPARIPSGLMPYEPWKDATITDPVEVWASLCGTEAMRLWKAIVETTRAHGHTPSHAIP